MAPRESYEGKARFVYDRPSDTMFVHLFGEALPGVSVPLEQGDRDYVYLRVDPITLEIVGIQIEDFLSYALKEDPWLAETLVAAEFRGLSPRQEGRLRAMGLAARERRAAESADFVKEMAAQFV